jgi:CRP/FNR family transcriptional regulator, cyclic AMP receptor protein
MPVDSLYFIVEGEVSIGIEEAGHSVSLGRMGPGEWLGEVSVLSGEMLVSSTVVAETPVKLLRLKHQAFEELITSNAEIGAAMFRHLVEMLAARLRMSQSVAAGPLRIEQATPEDDRAPRKPSRNWLAAFFGKE